MSRKNERMNTWRLRAFIGFSFSTPLTYTLIYATPFSLIICLYVFKVIEELRNCSHSPYCHVFSHNSLLSQWTISRLSRTCSNNTFRGSIANGQCFEKDLTAEKHASWLKGGGILGHLLAAVKRYLVYLRRELWTGISRRDCMLTLCKYWLWIMS